MHSQLLIWEKKTVKEVVAHMWALQAQDFGQAVTTLAVRSPWATQVVIDQAIQNKDLIRTRPMRWTLHFVDPENVHRMLDLCAAKTLPGFVKRRAFLWISDAVAEKSLQIFSTVLQQHKMLTRVQMLDALIDAWIPLKTQWWYHLLCYAATQKLICFWPNQGKENTFVLLDEWVNKPQKLSNEEALAKLVLTYMRGHGPATLQDCSRWSGLSLRDIKMGYEQVKDQLFSITQNNLTYYYVESTFNEIDIASSSLLLLPGFDEYFLAYKDRTIVTNNDDITKIMTKNGIFAPTVIKDWYVIGRRKRLIKKNTLEIQIDIFDKSSNLCIDDFEWLWEYWRQFFDAEKVNIVLN